MLVLFFFLGCGGIILYTVLLHDGSEVNTTVTTDEQNDFRLQQEVVFFKNCAIWPKAANYTLPFS